MSNLTPGASQGGIQSSGSTEFKPDESGTPKTGFTEAPASETCFGEPGPGIGNTRAGIR